MTFIEKALKNRLKNILDFGTGTALYKGMRKREIKMKKFYGSDDGYDYSKDNRGGDVERYVAWVQEWRKQQAEKKKAESPQK